MIKNNLSHIHFRSETRLPYPGERFISCSCRVEPELVRHFDETFRFEQCEQSMLGCRVRQPDNR
jgi:hypothetical protein